MSESKEESHKIYHNTNPNKIPSKTNPISQISSISKIWTKLITTPNTKLTKLNQNNEEPSQNIIVLIKIIQILILILNSPAILWIRIKATVTITRILSLMADTKINKKCKKSDNPSKVSDCQRMQISVLSMLLLMIDFRIWRDKYWRRLLNRGKLMRCLIYSGKLGKLQMRSSLGIIQSSPH